jgi:hypothetical protein
MEVHDTRNHLRRHRNSRCRAEHETQKENTMTDPVNHPPHYTSHPSGVECIQVTEHMGFNLGNAVKYVWRADLKSDAIEDLRKARWYIEREIQKRTAIK